MSKWDARDLAHAAAIEDAGDAKLVGDFVTVDFEMKIALQLIYSKRI